MKKICVVFGGASAEHDISIITAMQLAKNLESKFEVEKIYLDLNNNFFLATSCKNLNDFADKKNLKLKPIIISNGAIYIKNLILKKYCEIDCVINCCHGGVGENGELAAFFNINKIKYTSAGCLSSQIAMNKTLAKELVKAIVPTIKGMLVTKQNYKEKIEIINKEFSSNLIVKPNSLGSSIGVKVCNKDNFIEQINAIFELNDDALVEERIVDIVEYNQACYVDNEKIILSEIENPISKSDFLTFNEKYIQENKTKGKDRIIPAKISAKLKKEICNFSEQIYKNLKMQGVVRIDYIFDKSTQTLYFNEINTVPGSMAFYLFEGKGIDYITLIEKLINNATEPKNYVYLDTKILTQKNL